MPTDWWRELLDLAARYGDREVLCAVAEVTAEDLRHRASEPRVAALVEQAIREADDA